MNYTEALAIRDELDAKAVVASSKLKQYPRGNMGLTLDSVKAMPEWKADRAHYDGCAKVLGDFNCQFIKRFKAEWRQTLMERRMQKAGLSQ